MPILPNPLWLLSKGRKSADAIASHRRSFACTASPVLRWTSPPLLQQEPLMHGAVLDWFREQIPYDVVRGKSVLEVGSLDCGASLREVIIGASEYVGLDMRPGGFVDVVELAETFSPGRQYDYVVSAGTLEHCEDWIGVVKNMKRLAAPGGHILLTTVSPGFHRHNFPNDYWRWTKLQLTKAFSDFYLKAIEGNDQQFDVFLRVEKPLSWSETSTFSRDCKYEATTLVTAT